VERLITIPSLKKTTQSDNGCRRRSSLSSFRGKGKDKRARATPKGWPHGY
jgi:hypothetical protein